MLFSITEPRQLYDTEDKVANNISTTTEKLDDKPSIKQKGIYMRLNMVRYESHKMHCFYEYSMFSILSFLPFLLSNTLRMERLGLRRMHKKVWNGDTNKQPN